MLESLVRRTMTVPAARSQINMAGASIERTIWGMYRDGTLRIYGFGVQLDGYNAKVKESFIRCPTSVVKREKEAKKKPRKCKHHKDDPAVARRETKRQRR